MLLTNSNEGGTNGTTVTTGNSGTTSGTAWSNVSIGTTGTCTYSNTVAAHGTLSLKYDAGATADQVITKWTSAVITTAPHTLWWRFYINVPAHPAANLLLCEILDTAGTPAVVGWVEMTSTGTMKVLNPASTAICTTTTALSINTWYRLEGFVFSNASTGQGEIKIFSSIDSTSPTETQTSPATEAMDGTTIGQVNFGLLTNETSFIVYMDDFAVSDAGYPGPAGARTVLATNRTAVVRASCF